MTGQVRANTYYYEEGNVQFNLSSDFNETLTAAVEDESFANEIIKKIEGFENKVIITYPDSIRFR